MCECNRNLFKLFLNYNFWLLNSLSRTNIVNLLAVRFNNQSICQMNSDGKFTKIEL